MGGDQERAAAAAEVLLDPLEGGDVEVVRRLIEEEQVRIGDHESSHRRPRLLPAGECRGRLFPLVRPEAEAGQRLVDPLVEGVATEHLVLVEERRVARFLHAVLALEGRERLGHTVEVGGTLTHRRPEVRRRHECLVEVRLLGQQADRQLALVVNLTLVRLVTAGGDPEQRRLAGAVRADEADPIAESDRGVDRIEDDERSDLAVNVGQAEDRHG